MKPRGFDVYFGGIHSDSRAVAGVEIKPTVGDDYPAILRQIRRAAEGNYSQVIATVKRLFLLIGTYTGKGATEQQFRDFFKSQGVTVIFDDEVDAVELPAFDCEVTL